MLALDLCSLLQKTWFVAALQSLIEEAEKPDTKTIMVIGADEKYHGRSHVIMADGCKEKGEAYIRTIRISQNVTRFAHDQHDKGKAKTCWVCRKAREA